MVRPDLTLMFHALDKVLPLLEGSDDCQHLLVLDLIVLLIGGQGLGEEGDWVPLSSGKSKKNLVGLAGLFDA